MRRVKEKQQKLYQKQQMGGKWNNLEFALSTVAWYILLLALNNIIKSFKNKRIVCVKKKNSVCSYLIF